MAQLFQWDQSKLSINVKEMDDEHKELVRLMNILFDQNDKKASKAELSKSLKALFAYTVKHFADEEKYFSTLNYAKAAVHKRIHQDLLARLTKFAEEFEKGSSEQISNEFFSFLKVWLTGHIMGVDKEYGAIAKAG
jgi:hemerythrin